jgi:hypothetical protein
MNTLNFLIEWNEYHELFNCVKWIPWMNWLHDMNTMNEELIAWHEYLEWINCVASTHEWINCVKWISWSCWWMRFKNANERLEKFKYNLQPSSIGLILYCYMLELHLLNIKNAIYRTWSKRSASVMLWNWGTSHILNFFHSNLQKTR